MTMACLVSSDVYELLTCIICHERLKDAKVLACQHTFCAVCLISWSKQNKRQSLIECPTCRKVTALPAGHVNNLPSDLKVKQLMEIMCRSEASPKCVSCTRGKEQQVIAECYCKDCHDYLCKSCGASHQKTPIFEEHHLIYTEVKNCPRKHCEYHPLKFKDYYCDECQVLICTVCVTCYHAQHEVYEFQDHLNDCQKKTKLQLARLNEEFPGPISAESLNEEEYEKIISDIERKTKKVKIQILESANSITEAIDKQVEELTTLVDTHHNRLINRLKLAANETDIISLKERCTELLEFGNPLALLKESKVLSSQIDSIAPPDTTKMSSQMLMGSDFVYNDFSPSNHNISIGSFQTTELKDFVGKTKKQTSIKVRVPSCYNEYMKGIRATRCLRQATLSQDLK